MASSRTTARWPPRRSSDWGRRCRAGLGRPLPAASVARSDGGPRPCRPEWGEHLGDSNLLGDWTAFMRSRAERLGWEDLLLLWWPRLLPGLAASATHGVIRPAHALRSLSTSPEAAPEPLLIDELAQGLAFWAARYQRLPGGPRGRGHLAAIEATARLPRLSPMVASDGPGVGAEAESGRPDARRLRGSRRTPRPWRREPITRVEPDLHGNTGDGGVAEGLRDRERRDSRSPPPARRSRWRS